MTQYTCRFGQSFAQGGGYFQIRRSGGGGLDLTSSSEAKFGARSGQVHQIRRKTWEVLSRQDAKVRESPNFGVISEIQRAKFGVFVTIFLEAKFGALTIISEATFRAKPPPPDLLIWKYPPEVICFRSSGTIWPIWAVISFRSSGTVWPVWAVICFRSSGTICSIFLFSLIK